MRALVTGAGGFLGRRFTSECYESGYEVTGLDITWPEADQSSDFCDTIHADLGDWRSASHVPYDLIIHCAARIGGREGIDGDPTLREYNEHLDRTFLTSRVARDAGRIVYMSSSAVYPLRVQGPGAPPLHEDMWPPSAGSEDDMSAETGYGAAKRTGEDLACTFRGALIVRPFSGYASDQDPAYPYRAILERIRRREDPLIVWGSGTQVRDWTHADDLVQVVLSLAVETQVTGPVNIGTGQGTSVAALARMMAAAAGYTPRILSVSNRPEGVASRVADVTVLRRMLGPDGHDVLLRPIWTVIEDTPPAVWDVQA